MFLWLNKTEMWIHAENPKLCNPSFIHYLIPCVFLKRFFFCSYVFISEHHLSCLSFRTNRAEPPLLLSWQRWHRIWQRETYKTQLWSFSLNRIVSSFKKVGGKDIKWKHLRWWTPVNCAQKDTLLPCGPSFATADAECCHGVKAQLTLITLTMALFGLNVSASHSSVRVKSAPDTFKKPIISHGC